MSVITLQFKFPLGYFFVLNDDLTMSKTNSSAGFSSAEDMEKKLQALQVTQRSPDSFAGQLIYWIGILFAIAHIYFNTLGTWSELYVSATHFAGFN